MKITLLLLLFHLSLFAQSNRTDHIELNYKHSMQNFATKVTIDVPFDNNKPITLKACVGKTCRDTVVSRESFEKIYASLIQISAADLAGDFNEGGDGAVTTLKFGNFTNQISYSLWGVYKDDLHSNQDFVKAAQLILTAAGLTIEDYN